MKVNSLQDFFLIAKVNAVFGTEGFVSINSFSDDENRFFELKSVFIDVFGEKREFFVQEVKKSKNYFLLKFSNFDSSEDVRFLIGHEIFVNRKDSIILEDNSYFIHDLIGSKVFFSEKLIGILHDVINMPANDVYVIRKSDDREILIPAVKEFIKNFDRETKRLDLSQESRAIIYDEN